MQRVDYDQIAHLYDEPARDHAPDSLLAAYLKELALPDNSEVWILDIGCGTGKQLRANRQVYPQMNMVGVDLFRGMLRQAHKRDTSIQWVQGDGASLPLKGELFHYITNQYSYAHIQNKLGLMNEVFRALRRGGRFVLLNIDPWFMPDWILYRYFPEARDMDYQDFLPAIHLTEMMEQVGFADVHIQREQRKTAESLREFLNFACQRHRASHFMAISDEAYAAGIRRIQHELGTTSQQDLLIQSEMCFITVTGRKP